jgi:hypothetical protein
MPDEQSMPPELQALFDAADTALYNLHRGLELRLRNLPGKDIWRMVYKMRLDLSWQVTTMCENNLRKETGEPQ